MIADRPAPESVIIDSRQRVLLMAVRQALIMVLGALEDYLQMERSIVPKHRR
jgi:hypothetical protein